MQIWQIIVESVLAASASVLVICIIGALMYKTKKIDQAFTSQLAGLIERVILPSLIVTNIIRSVTLDQFWVVLPATVASVLVCVVGYIVGYLTNKYWIQDDRFEQLVILACADPHTTNIQLQVCSGL
jgi:predicted permease